VALAEVVSPAERDDTSLAGVAMELELSERQLADSREQIALLRGRDDVGFIAEAWRKRALAKEVELGCHLVIAFALALGRRVRQAAEASARRTKVPGGDLIPNLEYSCCQILFQIWVHPGISGLTVCVNQLALGWNPAPPGLEHGTRIDANFGRIQPRAFTRRSAIHKSFLFDSTGEDSLRTATRSDSLLIREIRVPTALGHPGRRGRPTDGDRIAIPKLSEEPKFGMKPPCTPDRLLFGRDAYV